MDEDSSSAAPGKTSRQGLELQLEQLRSQNLTLQRELLGMSSRSTSPAPSSSVAPSTTVQDITKPPLQTINIEQQHQNPINTHNSEQSHDSADTNYTHSPAGSTARMAATPAAAQDAPAGSSALPVITSPKSTLSGPGSSRSASTDPSPDAAARSLADCAQQAAPVEANAQEVLQRRAMEVADKKIQARVSCSSIWHPAIKHCAISC